MKIERGEKLEELINLQKARYCFYKVVEELEGRVEYSPPKQMGWSWIFDYKDFIVQEDTEEQCYKAMTRNIENLIKEKVKRGEM